MTTFLQDLKKIDEETGHFGQFGGRFVPEALISALDQLEDEYLKAAADPKFNEDFQNLLKDYVGRPSPLTEAKNFSKYAGGARVFLKREDLNHTGSHKINNVIGQALLTVRMGKKRIIAETAQDNMALLQQQLQLYLVLNVLFTWVKKILFVNL